MMPYEVKKSDQCPSDKPWGLFNSETGRKLGCHATKADAQAQMAIVNADAARGKPAPATRRIPNVYRGALQIKEVRADNLPGGVCAQISAVFLTYGTRDTYGTRFMPGCLDRTKAEKLAAGKIKFYDDHFMSGAARRHIGTVRTIEDVGNAAIMTADVFDTEAGRAAAEYMRAVLASESQTGFSVGFWERAGEAGIDEDGDRTYDFTEIELDEISVEPSASVEGTQLLGVRRDPGRVRGAFDLMLAAVGAKQVRAWLDEIGDDNQDPDRAAPAGAERRADSSNAEGSDTSDDAHPEKAVASMSDRMLALRRSFAPLTHEESQS